MFEGFALDELDVGDVTLRVRHGGRGPAVVLLHGHPRTHATWHRVAPLLAQRHTVVCPDLRGYGRSTPMLFLQSARDDIDIHGDPVAAHSSWTPAPPLPGEPAFVCDTAAAEVGAGEILYDASSFYARVELRQRREGPMAANALAGGRFELAADMTVNRMGYGAMQLAGPGVFGPPKDREEAVAVLREALAMGIDHIDTSDFYGPYITNEIIREALHPYPDELRIVTKVGALRDAEGGWPHARSPEQLREAVHSNLRNLGLEALDVVNLRVGGLDSPEPGSIAEPFGALVEMQRDGLIRHLGVSTVSAEQVAEAQSIAPIVCVQNFYNIANRSDDDLVDSLAEQGIAYVPYFPLGGFTPLQSGTLDAVAARLDATPMSVAVAWLLQRSPNILLIPGTSSLAHLRENVAGAALVLSDEDLVELNGIA